jgi:hypothetical protein
VDETVAVGSDAAGNVLEIVWLGGGAPISRIQLSNWTDNVVPGAKLMMVADFETYDKRTGAGIDQWNLTAADIEVP